MLKKIACITGVLIMLSSSVAISAEIKEYAIALQVQDSCTQQAEHLNKQIAAQLPWLKNTPNKWHVTLYHAAFNTKDIDAIYAKLKKVKLQPMTLNFTKIYPTADRWISWDIQPDQQLQELHTNVVSLATVYHKRPIQRAVDAYAESSPADRRQIDQYGINGLFEQYHPHMTLYYQYPPDHYIEKVAAMIAAPTETKCKIARMVIGELGYNGNILNIVKAIDFPK